MAETVAPRKPRMRKDGTPVKDYPKPNGPMVEWYLGANDQYKHGERIPYSINGYNGEVTVGARNRTNKEVMELFKNTASRTSVVDVDKYQPSAGGVPRKAEDFFNPQMKVVEQCDFHIELLKEE